MFTRNEEEFSRFLLKLEEKNIITLTKKEQISQAGGKMQNKNKSKKYSKKLNKRSIKSRSKRYQKNSFSWDNEEGNHKGGTKS